MKKRGKNIACRCCKSLNCMSRAHRQNVNLRFAHSPSRRRRRQCVVHIFINFIRLRENSMSFCHLTDVFCSLFQLLSINSAINHVHHEILCVSMCRQQKTYIMHYTNDDGFLRNMNSIKNERHFLCM